MNRTLRIVALAAILLGLSGCNLVVSEEPWFSEAEAQPKPRLRDGLWLAADPGCRVDEAKPAERWPDCASASFVRGDETWTMDWETAEGRGRRRTFAGWKRDTPDDEMMFVANGDHLIAQGQSQVTPEGTLPAEIASASDMPAAPSYMYLAFRFQLGDDGKAIAMESWSVQCGPLPVERRSRGRRRQSEDDLPALPDGNVTDRPFPGLTVVDDNCTAESADAVRNASVLSEALGPPTLMRWIRDGWH
ncbi:MAG TPA: hypothetical protein VI168_14365 [Croceibacterium sp.]